MAYQTATTTMYHHDIKAPLPDYADESAPAYSAYPEPGSHGTVGLRLFPPAFNFYFNKGFSQTYHIGVTAESPAYAVRLHSGLTRNPEIALHNGNTGKEPLLGGAKTKKLLGCHLLGAGNQVVLIPAGSAGNAHDIEELIERQSHGWRNSPSYRFSVPVGGLQAGKEGARRKEVFEWRSTRGEEIRELAGWGSGWKLVRLGQEGAVGAGGDREHRAKGESSDGKEIVAVWAHNCSMSMTKAMKFQFMGSAVPGHLGDYFELVAVLSALKFWYIEWANNRNAASSASAASASSAAVAAA